jgi:hypothetical protein
LRPSRKSTRGIESSSNERASTSLGRHCGIPDLTVVSLVAWCGSAYRPSYSSRSRAMIVLRVARSRHEPCPVSRRIAIPLGLRQSQGRLGSNAPISCPLALVQWATINDSGVQLDYSMEQGPVAGTSWMRATGVWRRSLAVHSGSSVAWVYARLASRLRHSLFVRMAAWCRMP